MSEQKAEVDKEREEVKPTKAGVSDDYYKGYIVGYNRAVKRFKKNKVEIEVKKEPKIENRNEDKINEDKPSVSSKMWVGIIIAVVLGLVVFLYVVRTRNIEPNQ